MKVIIALDELACANQAIEFALKHNWGAEPEFRLVHVVSPVMVEPPLGPYPLFLEEACEQAEADGKRLLEEAALRLRKYPGAKVHREVIFGYPSSTIVDMAKQFKADMIIVGTHNRHGLSRFLLGSVSGEVGAHAPCSVLVLQLEQTEKVKEKEPGMVKGALAAT